MYAAGTGGGDAHTQSSRELRITASRESRRFFMPHLDEFQLILVVTQSFENPVNAIAWQTEDSIDAPVGQPLEQKFGNSRSHALITSASTQYCWNLAHEAAADCADLHTEGLCTACVRAYQQP